MPSAPLPHDEDTRIAVLADYDILDTLPDPRTDVFVQLAADVCETPISLVSLVDRHRQWFKASIGTDATETPRSMAFCAHAILAPNDVMVIEDATVDPRFADNDLVTGAPHVRFYAGAPILSPEGYPLGTLCVIDDKPRSLDQAGQRRLQRLAAGVASVLELHRSARRLSHSATHDLLTGLCNRALFEPALDRAASRAAQGGPNCAVLCLDLDRFKQVNDRFGHAAGDAVLQAAAARLQGCIRGMDLAVRLGGDEFAVLLSSTADPTAVRQTADRIIEAFAEPLDIDGTPIAIRTSIGFAVAPADGDDGTTLMRMADAALYRAKTAGRGTVVWHGERNGAQDVATANLLADLRQAIHDGAFRLAWQPYFDVRTGTAIGQEALIRWNRPGHGRTPPDVFIPAAEGAGLITAIDAWVLRAACAEAATWMGGQSVSVNVSPAMFCSEGFVTQVTDALRDGSLPPGRLVIEITERTALDEHEGAASHFQALHEIGVRIALDDFGSGHTSLSYLQKFEFDTVKLDRSLVENVNHVPRSRMALSGMIHFARSIGLKVCAEGIETRDQLEFLHDAKCDIAQGYLMGRPTDRPEFVAIDVPTGTCPPLERRRHKANDADRRGDPTSSRSQPPQDQRGCRTEASAKGNQRGRKDAVLS